MNSGALVIELKRIEFKIEVSWKSISQRPNTYVASVCTLMSDTLANFSGPIKDKKATL